MSENVAAEVLKAYEASFDPPSACGDERCKDVFPEFIYIVIIPASVVVFILNIIFISLIVGCCIRRKRKQVAESEEQLATYEAVRRVSTSVRRMSQGNSTPLADNRSGSMSLARNDHRRRGFRPRDSSSHSAPGTLQRHHRNRETASLQDMRPLPPPPPPYGVRQDFPLADDDDDDSAFLEPGIQLQDFPAENAAHEADDPAEQDRRGYDLRHHRHPRHPRRQRPYSAANGYMTR